MKTNILSKSVLGVCFLSSALTFNSCTKSDDNTNTPPKGGGTSSTQIYYRRSANNAAEDELWVVNASGTNDHKINISLPSGWKLDDEDMAEVSKDGKNLAFLVFAENPRKYGMYTSTTDGTHVQPVLTQGGDGLALQGFIDQSSVLFWQATPNYDFELYRVNLDGSNKQKINIALPAGETFGDEELAKITADGKSIVFLTQTASNSAPSIYKCNLDGTGVKLVLNEATDASIALQDLTSDGVALYRKQTNDTDELWSVKLDGSDKHKINISLPSGQFLQDEEMAKATSDGNLIFSTTNSDGSSQAIYKSKLDGTGVTLVKQIPTGSYIAIQSVKTITVK
ncbi:DUF5050 domain-containing protein [Mucilaginibacter sp. CAU 1740]|uniref:DUF5050 domain-containing protein n=1 Tax=Mucilaginibacter sp. CAU 1740 TaxID=3140365 RepID=UPI00325AC698